MTFRFNPSDFGPFVQGTDVTASIQAAINAAKANNGGRGATLEIDSGYYKVDKFDCTGAYGLVIDASPGTWLYACNQTVAAPVFDFTASANCQVNHVVVAGQQFRVGAPPPVIPLAGFLFAESSARNDAGSCWMDGVATLGAFNSAALSINGAPDCRFRNMVLQQDKIDRPCVSISTAPDWFISSQFKTLSNSAASVGDQLFEGCEFHGYRGPNQLATTYMRNADNIRYIGCLHDCSGVAHQSFQGVCNFITHFATKFYTESGTSPGMIFTTDGTVNSLCVVNSDYGPHTGPVSNGSFPSNRYV